MNEVMAVLVQYAPSVVSFASIIATVVYGVRQMNKMKKGFASTVKRDEQLKIEHLERANLLIEEQNKLLKASNAKQAEENAKLRRAISELTSKLNHVEFKDK